ncbi:MAG TPA: hypothetical protein P5093_02495, partial [Ottowia sp.]|uniref:hypothetical protein n=1 Tax=Ottowia sp. TaxID=1898956 RepID=UPI002BC6213D
VVAPHAPSRQAAVAAVAVAVAVRLKVIGAPLGELNKLSRDQSSGAAAPEAVTTRSSGIRSRVAAFRQIA